MSWQDFALCRDLDTSDVFYWEAPAHGNRQANAAQLKAKEDAAKAICAQCPVTQQCLDAVLALPRKWDQGIWGATTEEERRVIRRQRGEPVPLTVAEQPGKAAQYKRDERARQAGAA